MIVGFSTAAVPAEEGATAVQATADTCDNGGGVLGGVGWAVRVAVVGRTLADGAADSAHAHAAGAAMQPA